LNGKGTKRKSGRTESEKPKGEVRGAGDGVRVDSSRLAGGTGNAQSHTSYGLLKPPDYRLIEGSQKKKPILKRDGSKTGKSRIGGKHSNDQIDKFARRVSALTKTDKMGGGAVRGGKGGGRKGTVTQTVNDVDPPGSGVRLHRVKGPSPFEGQNKTAAGGKKKKEQARQKKPKKNIKISPRPESRVSPGRRN